MIFHLDLDAFFASVEQLDHPEWVGKPVIVGALPGHRGVVSTCSYEARAFGVRSALPISKAFALCPQGVFVAPHFGRYQELSRAVMEILRQQSPRFCQMSIDEAYLDMRGMETLIGPLEAHAGALKRRILSETGLKVSVGIAPNWYLAKIASDFGKPDGLFVIEPDDVEAFLEALPLKKLHGAGGKTRERLEEAGFRSVAALRRLSAQALEVLLGPGGGKFVWQACRGEADYNPFREARSHSISAETTFEEDTADEEVLLATLQNLCQEVAFRTASEGLESRTPHLKLRWTDFTTVSGQTTREAPVSSSSELLRVVEGLFRLRWKKGRTVRLIGVGLSNVLPAGSARQELLFGDSSEGNDAKQAKVEKAIVERMKKKPGEPGITKASLLKPGRGPRP
ncbi:MAG: DNA polymerase IV [Spirochaetales bacterium]